MRMYRWVAKNANVLRMILFIAYCVSVIALYSWCGWSILDVCLMGLIVFLAFIIFRDCCRNEILKKGIAACEEYGDPEGLLKASEELLSYGVRGSIKQIVQIDYCDALRWMGQYDKTYEMLRALNIDKEAGTLPINKVIYYFNLSDVCTMLGKYDEANIWYEKMMLIFADIKSTSQRKMVEHIIWNAKAYNSFRKGDYQQTLKDIEDMKAASVAANIQSKNTIKEKRNMQVDMALLSAKAYMGLGDTENAKKKLMFVIGNGYKLYAVVEAKKMLENMVNAT